MKEPPPAKNLFLALFACAALFCSCAEDSIKMDFAQAYIVFDWQDYENPPDQSLALFMSFASNVRRLESVNVRRGEFSWVAESPIMMQAGENQWAIVSRLEPPGLNNGTGGAFETGAYSVECVDAAGEKSESRFNLAYNSSLIQSKAEEALQSLPNAYKRLAVYSEANELLFFSAPQDNWYDDASIFRGVKNSSFYRETYMAGSVFCFMPKIYKDGEKPDGLE